MPMEHDYKEPRQHGEFQYRSQIATKNFLYPPSFTERAMLGLSNILIFIKGRTLHKTFKRLIFYFMLL